MRFDPPGISPGGVGGHGPIGYRVENHEPGRSVTFRFTGRPRGLIGRHQYIVQATGADSCVLWHLTDITPQGLLRLTWFTFWGPLHNALIEDSLDRAQGLGVTPAASAVTRRSRWSPYVRGLRVLGSALRFVSDDRPRTAKARRTLHPQHRDWIAVSPPTKEAHP
jgi:hypothetical protein